MHRLWYPDLPGIGARMVVGGAEAKRIQRVLRLGLGQRLILFDGAGREAEAEIVGSSLSRVEVVVLHQREVDRESPLRIHLIQALPRGERIEWAIQKATELGVHEIGVLMARRSVPRWDPKTAKDRLVRWRRIAQEAARQCGRTTVPILSGPWTLEEFCEGVVSQGGMKLVLWEAEDHKGLKEAVANHSPGPTEVWMVVGPEGGFEASEVRVMERAGFSAVRLGPRILRTETAGPTAIAILQYVLGDLG